MTLQVRTEALASEIEYLLDCAVEASELDACTAMTLRLYGDNDEIRASTGGDPHCGYEERFRQMMTLTPIADRILVDLPIKRQAGLMHLGLRGLIYEIETMAETFANWAMSDEIEGGCLLPFRDRAKARKKIVFKNTSRRLYSPGFIRRYVKAHKHDSHCLVEIAGMMRRRTRLFPSKFLSDSSIMEDYRRLANAMTQPCETTLAIPKRKMLLRSLRMAQRILGDKTVAAFCRGETVKIMGPNTVLMLQKRGRFSDVGHGCLSVVLADQNGAQLADLCTFVEATPTLDQLSAFALWMMAGEERELLRTSNIITLHPAGESHPLLIEKRGRHEEEQVEALADLIRLVGADQAKKILDFIKTPRKPLPPPHFTNEEQRARNDTYWQETKFLWIDAMMVMVIGRDRFMRRIGENK